jgi:hypothetical protein
MCGRRFNQCAPQRLVCGRRPKRASASEQQYESEVRLYNGGHSTTYLVLDRQVALKNARGVELKGQMDLNKAISEPRPCHRVELSDLSILF